MRIMREMGAGFGPTPPRSTPVYAGGKLFTVAGPRRHVVALDLLRYPVEPASERWTITFEWRMVRVHGSGCILRFPGGSPCV